MKDLLHRSHAAALARFLGAGAARGHARGARPDPAAGGARGPRKVLLAFDYDGVLAPLVKDPAGARMRASTRALLGRVARRYPVAVVSGRAWKDVAKFVDG